MRRAAPTSRPPARRRSAPFLAALALGLLTTLASFRPAELAAAQPSRPAAAAKEVRDAPKTADDPKTSEDRQTDLTPTKPRPISARSLAHLFERMSKQPPLVEHDLTLYLQNLEAVTALDDDPSKLGELLELTGWTEDRLTYALAKIGLGLAAAFAPDDQALRQAPEFARPTEEEATLIDSRLDDFSRAFKRLAAGQPKR
ncbi:MAG: hypothetical protein LBU12_03190 [Deltaproteobacteria bacterium]|jgi:hypothetical protein|nr:hypothetical protein [Deltaproteobacteria bacterium]